MRSLGWLVLLLVGCTQPIVVGLQDTAITLERALPIRGYVAYPSLPRSFDQPALSVKTATIQGVVRASGLSEPITLRLFARVIAPSVSGCKPLASLYLCPTAAEETVSALLAFPAGESSQNLVLNGEMLVQGINQGYMWLGVAVLGGKGSDIQLEFSGMRAVVTLF